MVELWAACTPPSFGEFWIFREYWGLLICVAEQPNQYELLWAEIPVGSAKSFRGRYILLTPASATDQLLMTLPCLYYKEQQSDQPAHHWLWFMRS